MDHLTLLQQARQAGLSVAADGDHLVIRGPRSLQEWVATLRDHKAEVLLEIRGGTPSEPRHVPGRALTELTNGLAPIADPPPGNHIDGWPLEPDPPLRVLRLPPEKYLDTIAAQHCHPRVLAERFGMPVDELLRRLESSPWSGHGAAIRARLGLRSTSTTSPTSRASSPALGGLPAPASPDRPLHFWAG